MTIVAVVGGQWGDEGKGKIVDVLAGKADMVIRAQGGDNAGHTVVNPQGKFALHLVPAGVFNPATTCIIGNGVALNPAILLEEMDLLASRGVSTHNLYISERAHMVMPYHLLLERVEEAGRGNSRIGTTGRGIGPTYVDKAARIGIRAGDLAQPEVFRQKLEYALKVKAHALASLEGQNIPLIDDLWRDYLEMAQRLKPHIAEISTMVGEAVESGKTIVIEGAHGTLLDIDHGTYPYVTASCPSVAGLCQGAGIGPTRITTALGVFKAYTTRVGGGPMPTQMPPDLDEEIRERASEYGTTTRRPRRCGWFDAVAARYSVRINGFDSVALTRLDILSELPTIKICTAYRVNGEIMRHFPSSIDVLSRCEPCYEEMPGWLRTIGDARTIQQLPLEARNYVARIQELVGARIDLIGVGEERDQTICRRRLV